MATIRDVAKAAGVSGTTVSRFLNGGYVGEESRKKIEKAINELDYRVDVVARALSQKSSKTIGLIIPTITNPFFPELAQAIEEIATAHNYKLVLCNTGDSIKKELDFINTLSANYADGIITATGNCSNVYVDLKKPIVSVDRKLNANITHISSDNFEGGKLAVRHLYDCGCKAVLFLRQLEDTTSLLSRQDGFTHEAERLGMKNNIVKLSESDINADIEECSKLLESYDGIFTWNDITAIQLMNVCYKKKVKVPDEVKIIGYDNIYISKLVLPNLTTVSQDIYGIGRLSINTLLDMIKGEEKSISDLTVRVKLVIRGTTISSQN